MKLTVNTSPINREAKITIRLEAIFLFLELLKINGYIDWSWFWISSVIWIPMILGRILRWYAVGYAKKILNQKIK